MLLADERRPGRSPPQERERRLGFLDVLYVAPEARGTGVAAELVREAASALRERGAEVLELDVLASNERARAVYERWGFSPVELTLAAPIDALVRRLDAATGGPTFGSVHVQTDDVTTVERAVQKVAAAARPVGAHGGDRPRQRLGHRRTTSSATATRSALPRLAQGAVVRERRRRARARRRGRGARALHALRPRLGRRRVRVGAGVPRAAAAGRRDRARREPDRRRAADRRRPGAGARGRAHRRVARRPAARARAATRRSPS